MSKFHVNDSGEPGKCSAEKGGCPFGGDAQHYASPEDARTAFELSMAGKQIPSSSKKSANRDSYAYDDVFNKENFDPAKWSGFEYGQVTFDRGGLMEAFDERNKNSPYTDVQLKEVKSRHMAAKTREWKNAERTDKAKSGEEKVPIRLVPVGSKVYIGYGRNRKTGVVGNPQILDDGEVVGRYRDVAGQWDYVGPDTTFDIAEVDESKSLSPRWREVNENAALLHTERERYYSVAAKILTDRMEAKKRLEEDAFEAISQSESDLTGVFDARTNRQAARQLINEGLKITTDGDKTASERKIFASLIEVENHSKGTFRADIARKISKSLSEKGWGF